MKLFEYKPLYLPLIDALPEKLFSDAARHLGQLSLFEQEQEAVGVKILQFPMGRLVELPVDNSHELGAE